MTTNRREFLGYGTAITTGLAMGAFTTNILAAAPKTMGEGDFVGGFDARLDDAQIRQVLVGNTMEGVTYKGQEYAAYIDPDGMIDKMIGDRREQGRWDIKDGTFDMQFPTLGGGNPFALQVYQHNNGAIYKGWSPTEQRWTWFVPVEGKASTL